MPIQTTAHSIIVQKNEALIRRLVERFIEHPRSLMISLKEFPGCVYWTMQAHADDHAKLVGKGGSHYDALRLIIAELGRSSETLYILRRFIEPEPAPRRERMARREAVIYDCIPARDLLCELLESMGIGQFTNTVVSIDQHYDFHITVRDADDIKFLTESRSDTEHPMTIKDAIATLFRAYANRDGVRFGIEVRLG